MSGAGERASEKLPVRNDPPATDELKYVSYGNERESPYLSAIRQLISNDLSEPYSIYVFR